MELATAAKNMLSDYGTVLTKSKGTMKKVLHHIREGVPSNWRSTTQERLREVFLEDGRVLSTLVPEGTIEMNGKPRMLRLTWEKVSTPRRN